MFRRLLIEANLGASQQLQVPYQVSTLPLEKLVKVSKQYMEENKNNVDDLPQTPLFQEMIETSIIIDKFLRMNRLRSENQEFQQLEDAFDEHQMELEDEKSYNSEQYSDSSNEC